MNLVLPVKPAPVGRNCYVAVTTKLCIKKVSIHLDINESFKYH